MKILNIIRISLFVLVFAAFAAGSILVADMEYSENENRSLSQFPTFSADNILDGSFQSKLEDYMSDQFPFRDMFMSMSSNILVVIGRTEIGGAYVGKEGYYFEQVKEEDVKQDRVDKNIESVRKFFESCNEFLEDDNLCFMLVPTSGYICSNYLPENAPLFNQQAIIEKVEKQLSDYNVISIDEELRVSSPYNVYYKTDHHWTSKGAYVAAQKWAYGTDRYIRDIDYYDISSVATDFRGSLYSKVLDSGSAYDEIYRYDPVGSEQDYTYEIMVNGESEPRTSFYDESKLSTKDKYQYFFGGNYSEVRITRIGDTLNDEEHNLLVIKDSFANAFVPFIAERFNNVYMIDLRYYMGDISTYLADKNITEVLVLYNVSNFISDANIYKLGEHDIVAPEEEIIDYPDIETEEKISNESGLQVVGDAGFEHYIFEGGNAEAYARTITDQADNLDEIADVYNVVVPTAAGITMPDNLIEEAGNSNMQYSINYIGQHMGSAVKFVNIYDNLMQHRTDYLYFRTDHHWTQLGAYYAYEKFCEVKGIKANALESYSKNVYDGFLGSLYQHTENETMKNNPDYVLALFPHSNTTMTVYPAEGDPFEWPVINDVSRYSPGTKYSAFIAGDNPFTHIHNNDLEDSSTAIVIKESYGNAFVPFLVDHYENVYVIDYRYYTGSISDVAKQHAGNCDVIYVNNVSMITSKYLVTKLMEIK